MKDPKGKKTHWESLQITTSQVTVLASSVETYVKSQEQSREQDTARHMAAYSNQVKPPQKYDQYKNLLQPAGGVALGGDGGAGQAGQGGRGQSNLAGEAQQPRESSGCP